MISLFKENKKYFKRAIQIAWPSVLESFFISLAGVIDTIMVSSLGTYAVAAVGLTTQPKFIGLAPFFAINVTVSAVVARRKGENRRKSGNETFLTAFLLTLFLCLVVSTVMVLGSETILNMAGSNVDTHDAANQYYRIIMGAMFFNVISMVINAAQRGAGNTHIAFTTNMTSSIVNIVFNYLLIQGHLGFPKMGIQGAALATVLGTVVASILSLRSVFRKDGFVHFIYIFRENIRPKWNAFRIILRMGSNMLIENVMMRVGFLSTAVMAAGLGTEAFAAHNAGMNVVSMGFALGDGMQVASVALTGASLGEGNKKSAMRYASVSQKMGFGISILLSIILLIFGRQIFSLYFQEEEILQASIMISRFIMLIVLLQISQMIYGAALRAAGDIRYTLVASIISVTIIRTVTTFVAVKILNLGLMGIWLGILMDQISRYLFMSRRFKQGKWVHIKI